MDIFSHFLWVVAIFKMINLKVKKRFSLFKAGLWGIFPDIFAFAMAFTILIYNLIFNYSTSSNIMQEIFAGSGSIATLTTTLYAIGHSLVIFLLVFVILYLIFKRPVWVLCGWLIHILIDIPLHDNGRWATPFLWPISSYTFNGIAWWQNSWIDFVNYALLATVWIALLWHQRRKAK